MTLFDTTIEQISLIRILENCDIKLFLLTGVYSFLISQKYFIVSNKVVALNKTNIDR